MARIRSVHPSLFTDEAWVSCSPLARLLVIGLWTDADDQGVFEWKPLQIKMRLLPGDTADVPDLLQELREAALVMQFEDGGKKYGAIRNFRRFQRPQKPNAIHPLPERVALFVGLYGSAPAPEVDQSRTGTVIVPQMEDGGGEGIKEDSDADASLSDCDPTNADLPEKSPPEKPKKRLTPTTAELDAIWRSPHGSAGSVPAERTWRALNRGDAARPRSRRRSARHGAAYASKSYSGDSARGVHRLIENDRWQSFTDEIGAEIIAMDPARDAEIRRRMIELAEQRAANA
jgi:hypothetical protein